MRSKLFSALLFFLFIGSQAAFAQVDTYQGTEWGGMTHREKFACVLATMVWMDACKVPLSQSPNAYISKIDELLSAEPGLRDKDLANIFAAVVYRNEPESRSVLQSIRK